MIQVPVLYPLETSIGQPHVSPHSSEFQLQQFLQHQPHPVALSRLHLSFLSKYAYVIG